MCSITLIEKVAITAQQVKTADTAVLPLPEATEHLFGILDPIHLRVVGAMNQNAIAIQARKDTVLGPFLQFIRFARPFLMGGVPTSSKGQKSPNGENRYVPCCLQANHA
jgi:hypothetical protein